MRQFSPERPAPSPAAPSAPRRARGEAGFTLIELLVVIAVIAAYLLFWPVPIEPVAWQAPQAPALEGPYAVNDKLANVSQFGQGEGIGPEDVAIDDNGYFYVGYDDGRIVRFDPDGKHPDLIADTKGRPLGLDFDPAGNLIVADGYKGLLSIAPAESSKRSANVLRVSTSALPMMWTWTATASPISPTPPASLAQL